MAAKKKPTRRKFDEQLKHDSIRDLVAAQKLDPGLSATAFAKARGLPVAAFMGWTARHGYRHGYQPRVMLALDDHKHTIVREVLMKERTQAEIAKEKGISLQTLQGWVARYGDRVRAEMGLLDSGVPPPTTVAPPAPVESGATLVSSGEPPRTKRPYVRRNNLRGPQPQLPERTALELRQPELPFHEPRSPVYEVQALEQASAESNDVQFLKKALRRALRERDAAMVMLNVLQRESPQGDE